ncbi:MAG: hypothetical protein IJO10_01775 [Clostridia bacterium]|nr:hypothetical protein [Clostridia bacterium]
MKKISRTKTRIAILLLAAGTLFSCAGLFLSSMQLWACGVFPLLVGMFLYFRVSRCPHCGCFFKRPRWSWPTAGYCRSCKQLMEYDR